MSQTSRSNVFCTGGVKIVPRHFPFTLLRLTFSTVALWRGGICASVNEASKQVVFIPRRLI